MPESTQYQTTLPNFIDLSAEVARSNVSSLLIKQRKRIKNLIEENTKPNFSLVAEIEEMHHNLSKVFSPISHLQNVMGDAEWREAYNACIPLLTDYGTELSQNSDLQKAYSFIMDNLKDKHCPEFTLLEKELKSFTLNGVNLSKSKQQTFKKLKKQLSIVQATFGQNVQDSTDSWSYFTDNKSEISGVTDEILQQAKLRSEEKNESGWRFALDYPTYHAIMTHADCRKLRQKLYKAWSTRASDQSDNKKWDNSDNIKDILSLRMKLSKLVGFKNFAEYSLAVSYTHLTLPTKA